LVLAAQTLLVSCQVAAQDAIRVQSDEVLVPTVVFNKELYAKLKQESHHQTRWSDVVVKNLTLKDFDLFEDGEQQNIGSVRLEPPGFRVVQDNLGKHPETVGSGGGLWAYPDLPKTDPTGWVAWPRYILAYSPPKSPVGSCHKIQVKVTRADVIVWTRSQYCNTPHPASDPLNGTEFGNKLEKAGNAKTSSGIDLRLNVAMFGDEPNAGRVYLVTSFPGESLQHEIRNGTLYATIGSLALVYREDGTLAARYSDFACCDYGDKQELKTAENETQAPSPQGGRALLPNRYQTQFSLAPGSYVIRMVISDGTHFGIQDAHVTVEGADPEKLSVAGVVLVRRVRGVPQNSTEEERVADSYEPLVSKGAELTPTASTDFFRDDTLFAYFEISNPVVRGQSGAKVLANLRILDSKSGTVAQTFESVDTATYYKAGNSVLAVGREVTLNHLAPGAYQFQVQAINVDGQKTEWRSADFSVMAAAPLELSDGIGKDKKEVILPTAPN
jgi:hypothetical protein